MQFTRFFKEKPYGIYALFDFRNKIAKGKEYHAVCDWLNHA
jgi:hypothetical protein